jgi:hypothetical protein
MTDDERRLLELLAGSDGCTDALLLAHGLAHDTMVDMVGVGFATAKAEHVFTPAGKPVEITRVWITRTAPRAGRF